MQREQPKSTENNERPKQLIYNQKQTKATKDYRKILKKRKEHMQTFFLL